VKAERDLPCSLHSAFGPDNPADLPAPWTSNLHRVTLSPPHCRFLRSLSRLGSDNGSQRQSVPEARGVPQVTAGGRLFWRRLARGATGILPVPAGYRVEARPTDRARGVSCGRRVGAAGNRRDPGRHHRELQAGPVSATALTLRLGSTQPPGKPGWEAHGKHGRMKIPPRRC
jgi:hypothetical protein